MIEEGIRRGGERRKRQRRSRCLYWLVRQGGALLAVIFEIERLTLWINGFVGKFGEQDDCKGGKRSKNDAEEKPIQTTAILPLGYP